MLPRLRARLASITGQSGAGARRAASRSAEARICASSRSTLTSRTIHHAPTDAGREL
jgi:hypothetical protein